MHWYSFIIFFSSTPFWFSQSQGALIKDNHDGSALVVLGSRTLYEVDIGSLWCGDPVRWVGSRGGLITLTFPPLAQMAPPGLPYHGLFGPIGQKSSFKATTTSWMALKCKLNPRKCVLDAEKWREMGGNGYLGLLWVWPAMSANGCEYAITITNNSIISMIHPPTIILSIKLWFVWYASTSASGLHREWWLMPGCSCKVDQTDEYINTNTAT